MAPNKAYSSGTGSWGAGGSSTARDGVLTFGAPLNEAHAAVILVHGRGANALSMRPLAEAWARPGLAFLAPDAARQGGSWYPYSFLAPIEDNQPQLSKALDTLDRLVKTASSTLAAASASLSNAASATDALATAGDPASERTGAERLLLVGFSQGACLTVEYAARHARRYGGVGVLSGGLIGPPGTLRDYPGSLLGTPIFLGCSDVDPHIPKERVLESEEVLKRMGAQVTARLYPDLPHTINDDEIEQVGEMIEVVLAG